MIETLNKASLQYLENKYISLETATPQQLSDAEAYGACFDWYIEKRHVLPNTADLASNIFVQKYALHDNDGICLEKTPEDMWNRIAKALAEEEVITNPTNPDFNYWFKVFRQLLENWKYTPQGSGLYVLGNTYVKASASNCFVVSTPEDNLESIFDTAKMMARIYAARGGCGVNISGLRPAGSRTNNAAKTSTGASSFMDFYSHVTSTIGQCIEETQIVLTKRGNIAIKDVMAGDLVWTKRGWIGNLETINNGIKPVYRLTTKRGYEILATNNHVFVGTNQDGFDLNEIQLGDFSIGDTIVMMPGTPTNDIQYVKLNTSVSYNQGHGAVTGGNRLNEAITLPDELTEELAYFIGYSFGNGYVELDNYNEVKEISLACSHAHPAIQTKLEAISNNLFSYSPSIRQRKGERCADVRLFSKKLGLYLAQNGLLKQKAGILEMPELVKQSKTSVQMAFISGYFDADGYASGAKKGYVIASICMSMLKNIQQMLMSAGIVSHITTEKRNGLEETKNWQDLHSLFITGAYSQKLAVSLLSESVKVSNKAFIAKRDTLLTPFNAKSYGVKYNNFSYVPDNSQYLSARTFSMLQEANEISDEILISDEVASVELVGDATVYDLRLESEHLYSCQGFNLHNSGRRGALMECIEVRHPDIFSFIEMKQDLDKQWFFNDLKDAGVNINDWKYSSIADRLKSTSHANVSVLIDNKFIEAVENDEDYELWYEFDNNQYPRISKFVKARDIWNKLIEGATNSAEPGILNMELIRKESPADCYSDIEEYTIYDSVEGKSKKVKYSFKTHATNPCAELPLSVGDSCCLGTHNLPAFVINPYKDNAKFDWVGFAETVKLSTRAQDNIKNIDIRLVPLEVNRVSAILGRRIGLGCTGLSDALAMLGLRYDTEEAIKVSERIYATLRDSVYAASIQLAEEKGAFPIYDAKKEINNPFLKRLPKELQGKPRRNIACLTNAPNGSMSILMDNTASGIEPCFDTAEYTRNVKKPGTNDFIQFKVQHQAYSDCITAGGNTACFVKANDIDGMMRIKLQSTLQKYIDHAISVTTNLPAGTTQEHVGNLYLQAFKSGCKGFTVYVDGCRTGVLNSIKEDVAKTHKVVERPKTTDVDIFKTKYKEKNYMILVGKTNNGPIEVFGGEEAEGLSLPTKYKKAELTKKSRGHYTLTVQLSEDPEDILKINNVGNRFPAQDVITLTRMISLSLRNGVSVSDICEQLQKSATGLYDAPAVFARVLKNYISDEEVAARMKNKPCPDCGKELKAKRESGCIVEYCESCAYVNSKCS